MLVRGTSDVAVRQHDDVQRVLVHPEPCAGVVEERVLGECQRNVQVRFCQLAADPQALSFLLQQAGHHVNVLRTMPAAIRGHLGDKREAHFCGGRKRDGCDSYSAWRDRIFKLLDHPGCKIPHLLNGARPAAKLLFFDRSGSVKDEEHVCNRVAQVRRRRRGLGRRDGCCGGYGRGPGRGGRGGCAGRRRRRDKRHNYTNV